MSKQPWGLVSIGYEGRTAEHLLNALLENNVSTLVDVRLTPLSRKPGLSKTRLAQACADQGITYVHLPALGNPKANREPFRNGAVTRGCVEFSKVMSAEAGQAALDQLEAHARDGLTAVLCFERDHEACHRQVVVREVSERLGVGAQVLRV